MDVEKTSVAEFRYGTVTVGTSAVSLPRLRAFKGVKLKANPENAGTISIGAYQLAAGEEVTIPVDRFDRLRITASQSGQRLHWIVV